MFAAGELRFLSNWCNRRGLHWTPGSSERPYVMLERRAASRPWRRMVQHGNASTLHILDETGILLAEASTLPALLGAVDPGDNEPATRNLVQGMAMIAIACAGLMTDLVL